MKVLGAGQALLLPTSKLNSPSICGHFAPLKWDEETIRGSSRLTEDFKTDAIKQIPERGHSIAAVSQRLGVSTHSMYAWIKRYSASPSAVVKDDQSAEIRRLKLELARVTEERDILKRGERWRTDRKSVM